MEEHEAGERICIDMTTIIFDDQDEGYKNGKAMTLPATMENAMGFWG